MQQNFNIGSFVVGMLTAIFTTFLVFVLGFFLLFLFAMLFLGNIGIYMQTSANSPVIFNFLVEYFFLIIQPLVFIVSSVLILRATWIKGPYFAKGFLLLVIPISIVALIIITKDLGNCYTGPIGTYGVFGGGTCPQ